MLQWVRGRQAMRVENEERWSGMLGAWGVRVRGRMELCTGKKITTTGARRAAGAVGEMT